QTRADSCDAHTRRRAGKALPGGRVAESPYVLDDLTVQHPPHVQRPLGLSNRAIGQKALVSDLPVPRELSEQPVLGFEAARCSRREKVLGQSIMTVKPSRVQ